MAWEVRLTDDAWADLKSLRRRDKKIHRAALAELSRLETQPEAGYALIEELAGYRTLHFWNDKYRIAWSLDPIEELVFVQGIGPKKPGFYDKIRQRVRALRHPKPGNPRAT